MYGEGCFTHLGRGETRRGSLALHGLGRARFCEGEPVAWSDDDGVEVRINLAAISDSLPGVVIFTAHVRAGRWCRQG